ncbi:MAG: ABC transporter permease, partial [Synechococcus sp.]
MNYILQHPAQVLLLLGQHLQIVLLTLAIAITIAVPLGTSVWRVRWLRRPVMGVLGIIYTIPNLALIVLLVPLLGLNAKSAIDATTLYSQVILVRNLAVGLDAIDPMVLEAGRAMGMNCWQLWWR